MARRLRTSSRALTSCCAWCSTPCLRTGPSTAYGCSRSWPGCRTSRENASTGTPSCTAYSYRIGSLTSLTQLVFIASCLCCFVHHFCLCSCVDLMCLNFSFCLFHVQLRRPSVCVFLFASVCFMCSYVNLLHLYETLGWWRRSYAARKVGSSYYVNPYLMAGNCLAGKQFKLDWAHLMCLGNIKQGRCLLFF